MSFLPHRCMSIPMMFVMLLQGPDVSVGMFGPCEGNIERQQCAQRRSRPNGLHPINYVLLMAGILLESAMLRFPLVLVLCSTFKNRGNNLVLLL